MWSARFLSLGIESQPPSPLRAWYAYEYHASRTGGRPGRRRSPLYVTTPGIFLPRFFVPQIYTIIHALVPTIRKSCTYDVYPVLGTEAHFGFGRFVDYRPKDVFGYRLFNATNRNRYLSSRLFGRLFHINVFFFAPCSHPYIRKTKRNFRRPVHRHIAIKTELQALRGAQHKPHMKTVYRYVVVPFRMMSHWCLAYS